MALFTFISLSLISPNLAQAGIFSFVSDLIIGKGTEVYQRQNSSQHMDLLSSALSSERQTGGGDITIVDETAILPDIMSGVSSDVIHSNGQINTYVVRPGDSLSLIATMFGVSVNTIIWGNDLSGSTIHTGQMLVILPISGIKYTIQKGDTLQSIAKSHHGDLQEILDYNEMTSQTKLVVGETIIIPDGEVSHTSVGATQIANTSKSSSVSSVSDGYFIKPVAKYVRTQGIHGYNAVDMAAPVGTPVVAAAGGTVIVSRDSGWNGGYGEYVVIKHPNGVQTLYSHMSRNVTSVGANVVQGQVIGYVGSTGKSTGPHLHFEVRGAKNPF